MNQEAGLSADFKVTELGLLPEEWQISLLDQLVEFTHKPRNLSTVEKSIIPFISMALITSDGSGKCRFNEKTGTSITSGVYCEPGDLLFAKITPCLENGKQCIVPDDLNYPFAYATTEVYALKPKREYIDRTFLFHYLRYPPVRIELASKMEGTTGRQRLAKHVLENLSIPIPPLPEQRAIAHVLSSIQRAIEAQDKVISAARELKKSITRHLFTYGPVSINKADQVELKVTEIGLMPENWELSKLGDLVDIQYGVQAAVANLKDLTKGIPILTNVNITNNGKLDLSLLRYYELQSKQRDKLLLHKGDMLFNWRSGSSSHVGKTAIFDTDGEYTYSSFILRFRPKETIDNEYLYHFFTNLKAINFFAEKRSQSSVNSVFNASLSSKIPVAVPPMSTQKSIAAILKSTNNNLEAEENSKSALQTLFKTMLHVLMTGQLRVKELQIEN